MTPDTRWHLDPAAARAYLAGTGSDAEALSAEGHLLACAHCRALLAGLTPSGPHSSHEATWSRLADVVDQPSTSAVERLLAGWLPPHVVRLIAAAPALRQALLGAGLALLVTAVLAAHLGRGPGGTLLFLVTAPVIPLLGVALAYSWRDDVAGEVAATLPYSRFRLLLLRTTAVAVPTVPLVALLSLALPVDGHLAALWLAPAIALCTLTLALSSVVEAEHAAAGLAALWLLAAVPGPRTAPRGLLLEQVLERSLLFRPAGQALLLGLSAVAVLVALARRTSFETWSRA